MRKILINTVIFLVIAALIPGVSLTGGLFSTIFVAIAYGFLSGTVEKFLKLIAFPINFVTFGLMNFLISVFTLWITSIVSGLEIRTFWAGALASIALTFLQSLLQYNEENPHR